MLNLKANQSTTKNDTFPQIPQELEIKYNQFLYSLSFSPALKGYPYIKQAIFYEFKNRHDLPALNKDIYEEISRLYRTEIAAVERCITFSVHRAYKRNPQAFAGLFPDCDKAPSNFHFLKTVSLYLHSEMSL